jgi:hypothetical protein
MTQDQVQAIMNAVAQMQSQVNSNSGLATLLETNPYQALTEYASVSWPPDVVSNFNASVVSTASVPIPGLKRQGGPDSWACFFCTYGMQSVMYAAVAAAGIAIAATGFGAVIEGCVAAVAGVVSLSAANISALALSVGTVSIATGISKLADLICTAIPNTCGLPPVITGPWSQNQELGWTTAYQPALVSFQGQPFGLHRGNKIDGQLYYAAFNPTTGDWPNDTLLANTSLNSGPTACVNSGVLCVTYLIQNPENALRFGFFTSDPPTWSGEMELPNIAASASALGMAEMLNNIVGVYPSAADGTLQMMIVSTSGQVLGGSEPIVGAVATAAPPSLEWFNGVLYCAYTNKTNSQLMLMSYSNNVWSTPVAVSGATVPVTDGPAICAVGVSTLYCLYTGTDSNLYYMSAQRPASGYSLSWSTPQQLQNQNSAHGPALVSQGADGLMALHRGTGGDQSMWWTTASPTST